MWPRSSAFDEAILAPVHTVAIRAEVLDTDDWSVVDTFYANGQAKYVQNYIVDGTVDVDSSRATRRTFNMNLLNPDGEFSPGSNWAGLFYVDRLVRLWRGIDYGSTEEYVPIGTFFIDHADVVVERNMSMAVLSGSDGWKKLTKAQLGFARSYASGLSVNTVLQDLLGKCGVTRYILDDLLDRATNAKTLNVTLAVERDDKLSDVVMKLATDFGLDAYFDPMGYFVTQDFRDPADSATVWTYDPDQNATLLSVRASYSDDTLYNHVFVVGNGDKDAIVYSNCEDNEPTSPTRIASIGRRTLKYESDGIATQEAADAACRALFFQNVLVSEDIGLDTICHPAFEANDVLALREATYAKLDTTYRIRSFSVPLASSRSSLKLQRAVNVRPT
jgi:hypothetical protein